MKNGEEERERQVLSHGDPPNVFSRLRSNISLSSSNENIRGKPQHKSSMSRRKSYFESFLVRECERISERKEKRAAEMMDPYTEGIIQQYLNQHDNKREKSQEKDQLPSYIEKSQKNKEIGPKPEKKSKSVEDQKEEDNEMKIEKTDCSKKIHQSENHSQSSLHDLVLQDLFQLSASEKIQNNMIKFHLRNLGTLFLINQSRTGKISQEELKLYTALVEDLHLKIASYQEVEVRLRSYSTLSLWIEIKRDRNSFINWFLSLLIENSKEVTRYNLYKASMERFGGRLSSRSISKSIDSLQRRSCQSEDISECHLDSFSGEGQEVEESLVCDKTYGQDCHGKRMDIEKELEDETKEFLSENKLSLPFSLADEVKLVKEIQDESDNEEYLDEDDANAVPIGSGYKSVFQLLLTRGEEFVDSDTLLLMHFLLEIESGYGISFQTFLDMLQQEAERSDLISLSDEIFDEVVPIAVVRTFIEDFVNGFESLMDAMKIEDAEELLVYCLS